jgi:hypothetical protein
MNCPHCAEAVEPGALYCGNCGQKLALPPSLPPAADPTATPATAGDIPRYALVNPIKQKAESTTMVGLILSVLSVPAAIVPFLGAALAVGGMVTATAARGSLAKKAMSNVAVAFASVGIIVAVGAYIYNINQYNKQQLASQTLNRQAVTTDQATQATGPGTSLDTPCYSASLPVANNTNNVAGSCTTQAFNAATMVASSDAYNLQAVTQNDLTAETLPTVGKEVAGNYLASSLPGFTVTTQKTATFAGSPAYYINAKNDRHISIALAIVVRRVAHGENVFVLVHAVEGQADLASLEQSWQWK